MKFKHLILVLVLGLSGCATKALAQHTVLCANDPTCVTTTLTGGGDVSSGANNVFTGSNSFTTNSSNFQANPVISSGGSATDGALCFGKTGGLFTCTGSSTHFLQYNATLGPNAAGNSGGYSFGKTFGTTDTLLTGPVQIQHGVSNGVLLQAASTGSSWVFTYPTSAGTNGYLLSTDGAGNTSWVSGSGSGTVTSVATGTGLTGGPITASGTVTCNTISSSVIGCGKVDGTTLTTTAGVLSVNLANNFTWTSGLHTFQTDPLISSGGSSTDGAIFFGTNLGTRYLSYNAAQGPNFRGNSGGYALGSTFGQSDTLVTGPVIIENGGARGVQLEAPASGGNYVFVLPPSGATNNQVLKASVSGSIVTTSWTTPSSGTVTSVGCGTGLSGGTITASGTCSVTTPTTVGSGYLLLGTQYIEYGGATFSGGTTLITYPQALSAGVDALTATAVTAGSCVVTLQSSNTSQARFDAGAGCSGSEVFTWILIGH